MLLDLFLVEFADQTTVIRPAGGKKHKSVNYLTAEEKRRAEAIIAKLEAELQKIPLDAPKTDAQKAKTKTIERKVDKYREQIIKLDSSLAPMIDALVRIVLENRRNDQAKLLKHKKRERNKRALLLLMRF